MKKREHGFTLVELLIVVAIIGILAAMAIPNLLTAVNRAKQKRTISDIRNIAQAWEAYAVDNNGYSAAAATYIWPAQSVPFPNLEGRLIPAYIKGISDEDGWGMPYEFATDVDSAAQEYAIRSGGHDRKFDGDSYDEGMTSNIACDIVYANGTFVTYPQAAMSTN